MSTGGASRGVHWWSWQGCPLVELAGMSNGGARGGCSLVELAGVSTGGASRGVHWWS